MNEQITDNKEKYLQQRVSAKLIGVQKTHELVPFGVDDLPASRIEQLINEIGFYDETSRSVVGMGICLPSLINFERKYPKNDGPNHKSGSAKYDDPDYKRTTLFNHYLNSYIESMEYPESATALMDLMKRLLEGRINISDDELLDRFSSAFTGQWNEQAVENALIANNCICSEASVEEDGKGVDLLVVGNDRSIYKIDVKSSLGSLEPFGKAFVSEDGIEGYSDEEKERYYATPGFAVSLGPKKRNILLVITGIGSAISRTKIKDSSTGKLEQKTVFMPVPKFGNGGDFDMSKAISVLRDRYLAIGGAAKVNLPETVILEKFGIQAARIILNN